MNTQKQNSNIVDFSDTLVRVDLLFFWFAYSFVVLAFHFALVWDHHYPLCCGVGRPSCNSPKGLWMVEGGSANPGGDLSHDHLIRNLSGSYKDLIRILSTSYQDNHWASVIYIAGKWAKQLNTTPADVKLNFQVQSSVLAKFWIPLSTEQCLHQNTCKLGEEDVLRRDEFYQIRIAIAIITIFF